MSRQSKQAKNAERAKQFKDGGPEKTAPKHGKREGRTNPESKIGRAVAAKLGIIRDRIKDGRAFGDVQGHS